MFISRANACPFCGKRRRATALERFTLVELLVVTAVIAVLASLTLPVLGSARQTVKRACCASNMRSVYQGCLLYATDWNGLLPMTSTGANHIYYIADYLKFNLADGRKNDAVPSIGFSAPRGIAFCPSLSFPPQSSPCWGGGTDSASYFYSNYQATRAYSADAQSGCWYNTPTAGGWRRLDSIKDACVIMGDQSWAYVRNDLAGSAYACDTPVSGNTGLIASRYAPGWLHSRSSNFSFKDGHVSAYKYTGRDIFNNDYVPYK